MKPTVCRISVARVVPPEAEVIILGKLVDPVVNTETTMVSAVSTFIRLGGIRNGLASPVSIVCSTKLVISMSLESFEKESWYFKRTELNKRLCIPLSLMNTTDRPCMVKKNTIIAKMENVDTVETQINSIETEKMAVNENTAFFWGYIFNILVI
jgi:hypothetical protein